MPHSCADATCSTEQYWKGEEVSWNKEKGVNLATCVADSSWRILSRQKQSSSSDTHSMKSKPWMFTTLRSGGRGNCNKYCLQSRGWWCGTDRARVTSRLFSGPCKQSRPMTCSIMPFEEEASSVTTKKNQGVPLLTIGSSSWLQRGFCHAAHPKKLLDEVKAEKHRGEPGLWFVWCLPAFQFCSGSIDRSYHLTTYRSYKKYEGQKNLHLYLQDSGRQLSKQTAFLVINLLEDKCVLLIRMCIFDISFAVSIELNINPLNHSEY
ncbi:uncharacterized protein LOC118247810 isoform X4 [Cygnus atratus]|uniref:uncharacterized protein LOC118247810 isoform X4 n=1 Tax=Cygnus atratus TaxID=8868 RepID=UPI0021B72BFE|nr:uncharacterized protein LOC118247810 isoform X4 [Cygnus atratus]